MKDKRITSDLLSGSIMLSDGLREALEGILYACMGNRFIELDERPVEPMTSACSSTASLRLGSSVTLTPVLIIMRACAPIVSWVNAGNKLMAIQDGISAPSLNTFLRISSFRFRPKLCEKHLLITIMVNETQIMSEFGCQVGNVGQHLDNINVYVGNIFSAELILRVFTRPRPIGEVLAD